MRYGKRRGVSLGTIVMLTLTCLVLAGFFAMLPKLAGQTDLRFHASDIFVALDQTFSGLNESSDSAGQNNPVTATPAVAAATATATPAPTPIPKMSFSFCAGGQISYTHQVQKAVTADDGYHFEWILEPVKASMDSDLTLVTLANSAVSTDKLTDYNMPAQMIQSLKASNIDAVSLGHFNTLDAGLSPIHATRSEILTSGMAVYGAYSSGEERNNLTIYNANGVSVALLSYVDDLSSTGKKQLSSQPFAVASLDLNVVEADIRNAKNMGAQVIVVSVSWGKNGDTQPSKEQKETAQSLANLGADIIIGTHPEAVETIQILTAERGDGRYHPVLCAYSMGNLFSADREKRVNLSGLLLHAQVEYDPVTDTVAFDNLHYTPTYCWRGKVEGVYRYQVFVSNLDSYPDYVDKDQLGVMSRCLKVITDAMEGSIFNP